MTSATILCVSLAVLLTIGDIQCRTHYDTQDLLENPNIEAKEIQNNRRVQRSYNNYNFGSCCHGCCHSCNNGNNGGNGNDGGNNGGNGNEGGNRNDEGNRNGGGQLNPCRYNKYYKSSSQTGSCYRFHDIGATWVEAKAICEMEGAHLAIINDQREAQEVASIFASHPQEIVNAESVLVARVGLRKISQTWQWHDGSIISDYYSKWAPGEPSSPKITQCGGILTNGLLDDIRCNNQVAFICENKILI